MKQKLLMGLCLLFICSISYAGEFPAPFEKAKQWATKLGEVDEKGCYMFSSEVERIEYSILYCPKDESLCLVKEGDDVVAVCFVEGKGFVLFSRYGTKRISGEDAVRMGFAFFKELVKKKII